MHGSSSCYAVTRFRMIELETGWPKVRFSNLAAKKKKQNRIYRASLFRYTFSFFMWLKRKWTTEMVTKRLVFVNQSSNIMTSKLTICNWPRNRLTMVWSFKSHNFSFLQIRLSQSLFARQNFTWDSCLIINAKREAKQKLSKTNNTYTTHEKWLAKTA